MATADMLLHCGRRTAQARKAYEVFISEGTVHGKRLERTGGGFVLSAGGWDMLKSARKRNVFLESDERILGDSDFVEIEIASVEEGFEISRFDRSNL